MRSILVLLPVLNAAGFLLLAAPPETNSSQALQKAKQEFLDTSLPDNASVEQIDRFLCEHARKAAPLADRTEAFYRAESDGPRAGDAWERWMQLLTQGAMFDTNTAARLQGIEENFLRDPKLSPERRIEIRQSQFNRTRDPKKRERLVLAARGEIRRVRQMEPPSTNGNAPGFIWEEDLLTIADKLGRPGPSAYWLIDEAGKPVDRNADADLESKVERLLKGGIVYPP